MVVEDGDYIVNVGPTFIPEEMPSPGPITELPERNLLEDVVDLILLSSYE